MWAYKANVWTSLRKNVLGQKLNRHKQCFASSVWEVVRTHQESGSLLVENFKNRKDAITYGKLQENVENFSQELAFYVDAKQSSSMVEKTRIAFLCKPSIKYIVSLLSIWKLNAVAVPLSPSHPPSEVEHVVNDSGADIVLYEDDLKELVETIDAINLDYFAPKKSLNHSTLANKVAKRNSSCNGLGKDDAYIVYTSGTTGKPKGVVHTHGAIETQIKDIVEAWEYKKQDHILHFLPLHHLHGIVNKLLCVLYVGGTIEFIEADPEVLWNRLASNTDITLFMAVPTIYSRMIEVYQFQMNKEDQKAIRESFKTPPMRLMVSGSAALPVHVLDSWKKITGHTLLERYGMSEFCMGLTNPLSPSDKRIPGYVGKPFRSIDVVLCNAEKPEEHDIIDIAESDENGVSATGEIRIKTDGMFSRYLNLQAKTEESFDPKGYFKTGDIATFNSNLDSYKILGRNNVDVIKSKGYKISALEIERVLQEDPSVLESCVFGTEDTATYGDGSEIIVAMLRVATTASDDLAIIEQNLRTFVSSRLAHYKNPKLYFFVREIPKNAMGKVNKKQIRADYTERTFTKLHT